MRRTAISLALGTAVSILPVLTAPARAQAPQLALPRPSQAASVSQTVGLTEITIHYSRPLVKGRTIWGELVPYGQVWRAGANENTTISFSTPVSIGGHALAAGTYGVHTLPTAADWTLILSNNSSNWGSFSYEEKDDALRLTARPEPGAMTEALTYIFEDPTETSVRVVLAWEKLRLPFTVEVATEDVVIASLERELHGLAQFFWQPWNQAATYALQNDTHLDEAMTWIERSLRLNQNFTNASTKAQLLAKKGDSAAAEALIQKALPSATEAELNAYGYQLMGEGRTAEAVAVFKGNAVKYPKSWNAQDSYGEGLEKAGDKAGAIAAYKKALAMAPEAQKARIQGILDRLAK
jgi:tetratricopeptide (TPR) repeat protein